MIILSHTTLSFSFIALTIICNNILIAAMRSHLTYLPGHSVRVETRNAMFNILEQRARCTVDVNIF